MLKLVTRVPLSEVEELSMILTGELPAKLQGYLSGGEHPEPPAIGVFLRKNNFPWNPRYVSIFVYEESDDPDPPGAAIGAYGWPFLLRNESIINDLELVCSDDIQDAVLNGRPPSDFTDLSKLASKDAIEEALRTAKGRAPRYAEARLHRALILADVGKHLKT